ncbi:DUF5684 domain-containing protein [Microbacterium paludicola]|uniref:PSer/pThr/pTyr-binding forkhead associated (FHA) protein n=2 Tax=Microbacterium TaxID=33882 RepID=A0ABU1HYF7_9MICO|nr:DUF5684 domain-containing protein [Microbacterium paludicola]APF33047.1 hypothetical protein BO218_01575 [Microbacterium paludicola]MDR6166672.1 pSer/pThr/pTyr-binding forkhead associated (FHA) protein [Microbacterium paludicola]
MKAQGFTIDHATAVIALGGSNGGPTGAFAALGIVQVVVGIGIYVWTAFALTAVFRKTGIDPWRAWVPVLNIWELFVLAGMRGWWAAVLAGGAVLVTIISGVVAGIFAGIALNAGFGGDAGSAAGALAAAAIVPSLIWLAFIAFALVIHVRMLRALCRGFGLGTGFVVLGALLFPVWASVVGWGSARWLGREAPAEPGPFRTSAAPAAGAAVPTSPVAASLATPAPAAVPAPPLFAPPSPAPGVPAPPAAPAAPAASEPISASPWAPPPPPAEAAPADPTPQSWSAPAPAAAAVPSPAPAAAPAPALAADEGDVDERTVLAARRGPQTSLRLPNGSSVALSATAVVLGRNPLAPDQAPDAQAIAIDDVTRTVSKTHALLQHTGSGWTITDLASTNGVFVGPDDVEASGPTPVSGVFHLGDAELELTEA